MVNMARLSLRFRLLIVAVAIVLAGVLGSNMLLVARAQDGSAGTTPTPTPSGGEGTPVPVSTVEGPSIPITQCTECHPDVVAAWKGGEHAKAYEDPLFQTGWEAQRFDPKCLECHTTGYNRASGEFHAEGVTCEQCHGTTPQEHPPAPVDLNRSSAVCADCHLVTHSELRASAHYAEGLTCTSCHYAHNNGLRLTTEVEQCLNCHENQLNDFAHASHVESNMTCRDCHGYVDPGAVTPVDGLGPTGHDFQANMSACMDCHEDIELVAVTDPNKPPDGFTSQQTRASIASGQETALRANQLEAVLQTVLLQQRNSVVMAVIEGLVGGLAIGGAVVWIIIRRRSRREAGE